MKSVVVLSGGLDSTTALALKLSQGDVVVTMTFNYGSKHNERENQAAKAVTEYYSVPNILVDLPFINELFRSDLLKSGKNIPDGHYTEEIQKKTVVPFRNAIMLSIAVGYAESIGFDQVVIANHAGDHAIYPDCRGDFIEGFSKAALYGTYAHIKLESPFLRRNKTEIVKIGSTLSVPYELTYSCYKGGEVHCGVCGTCIERKEAFRDADVKDPTIYKA